MPIGVLVVDDSSFFRQQITRLINSFGDFKVIGTAINGADAVKKAATLKPGLITMDYEMPGMDGITAIREIMGNAPTPILMLSSLSYDGAKITLDALDVGAADYLLKDFESFAKATSKTHNELYKRLTALTRGDAGRFRTKEEKVKKTATPAAQNKSDVRPTKSRIEKAPTPLKRIDGDVTQNQIQLPKNLVNLKNFNVMVIGCSTGGPAALTKMLKAINSDFPLPVVIGLHMPEYFTETFAKRLDDLSELRVKEAATGDLLRRGQVYLAPGGKQTLFDNKAMNKIKVIDNASDLEYAPCVDVLFASAAKDLKSKVLALVLTGMGSDGSSGARLIKKAGGTVWAQDEDSSVVYGMPGAVAKNGLVDTSLSLDQIIEIVKLGK